MERGVNPITLETMPERGSDDPTAVISTRKAAIVIGKVNKIVLLEGSTQNVAFFGSVMAPAITGIAGYTTVRRTINVIALEAVPVRCGNMPPCVLKLAIIIGKINCAIRRRVLSSNYPAIRRGVSPPAGLISRN